jgi:hypothetical protein
MPYKSTVPTVCGNCGNAFLAQRAASTRAPARFCSRRCNWDSRSTSLADKLRNRLPDRPAEGCWEVTGSRTAFGYGQVSHLGTTLTAHRVSWELTRGPIPPGISVLHHCDNPPCVRTEPDEKWPEGHLFLGTQAHNMHDARDKGRMDTSSIGAIRHGEAHPRARLTAKQVRLIRVLLPHAYQSDIARLFGVSRPTVTAIATGRTWRKG